MNTSERSMQLRVAAHMSWAKTPDRSARTRAARRQSHHTRFVEKARELHPNGTEAQIAAAAEALKKAHYQELARRSAQARRMKRELAEADKQRRTRQLLKTAGATPATA
ncbi:hypothetical protein IMX12_13140 [Streptomyces sp. Babs14]|uniref:hypothetical protein n=1 Tax=unclassified Streptomyces TaxID=2593676 RepID=UPI001C23D32E|nr:MULTISPECIES: hypothetical protein [unclassified Streptomyces]MBU8549754.1 hypothetical protein [Streptomyces sp. Osf17]MBU8556537.1 hypothetical protein [Streptomyces sp. Babs14]